MRGRKADRRPKIDKWYFRKGNTRYEVPVYFQFKGYYEHDGFVALVPTDPKVKNGQTVRFSGYDLPALHAEIEAYFDGLVNIKWVDWLEITIDDPRYLASESIADGGIDFFVSGVQFGKDKAGNIFWRSDARDEVHKGKREGRYRTNYDGNVTAFVLDTPENRKALEQFATELNSLVERIKKFMSQKLIKKTLKMAVGNLLGYTPAEGGKRSGRAESGGG